MLADRTPISTAPALDERELTEHLARIEVDGYTIVELHDDDLVTRLRETIRTLEHDLGIEPRKTEAACCRA